MTPRVLAVLTGDIKPLGATVSGIDKRPAQGPQRVERLGIIGDRQADLRVHGGEDKAVHCYPWSHYTDWRASLPECSLLNAPGAFGENLSIDGMDERDVCIADRWRIGTAVFEVSQGRQPCYKLNVRFGQRPSSRSCGVPHVASVARTAQRLCCVKTACVITPTKTRSPRCGRACVFQ